MSLHTESLLATTIEKIANLLGLPVDKVDPERSFTQLGGSSLRAIQLRAEVSEQTGCNLDIQNLLSRSIRETCDEAEASS